MELALLFIFGCLISGIVCPPVKHQPNEGGSDTDEAPMGLEYEKYLKEVVQVLEQDQDFRKTLEQANASDIKSGAIAQHLERVKHNIREQLDELKRKEIDRLKDLHRQKMQLMNGKPGEDHLQHVDVHNQGTFEVKDLEKLILKATRDLEDIDKKRKEEFKEYEMQKEHERREHLKGMTEEERKKEEQKFEEMKKKHADHPKVHHPGSKAQLEEVWEEKDHLDSDDFDPKTFFKLHDVNGDGLLDDNEVESLFQAELDKVYDPNASEDDEVERYEEMNRMREHVMKEIDENQDNMLSMEEFMKYADKEEFKKDEGWETLEQQDNYTDEEYQKYEQMLAEEEARRLKQGSFDSHAQPGVVMQPQGGRQPIVQEMDMGTQNVMHQANMDQQQLLQQQQMQQARQAQFDQVHQAQAQAHFNQAQQAQKQAQLHQAQQAQAQAQLHQAQQVQAQAQMHQQVNQQQGQQHQGQPPVQEGLF